MNDSADANKLGQAVENLASTIIEIIESRVRQFAEQGKLRPPDRMAGQSAGSEGWVDMKAVAEHLQITLVEPVLIKPRQRPSGVCIELAFLFRQNFIQRQIYQGQSHARETPWLRCSMRMNPVVS